MRIGNLPQATSINDDDFFVVVQNGKTKRISKEILKIADDIVIEDNRIYLVINGQKIGVGIDLPQMTADNEMSDTSTNPVQNKVAKAYVDGVDIRLTENISSKFDVSVNLYNENINTPNTYIDATTGELVDSSTYATTDFIHLDAGQYTMTYIENKAFFGMMARYNLDKEFINGSRVSLTNGNINIPETCYVRFSGTMTRLPKETIMLVKGTELPTEYVPYYVKLKPEYLPDIDVEISGLSTVTIADTDFIKTSSNLINQMTIEKNKYISSAGVKGDSTQNHITDKIYLKTDTEYTALACYRISYFDKENKHIKSVDIGARTEPVTFTTPSNFKYAIVTLYYNANIDYKWQLNEGNELLPYEPQHLIVNGYRIYDEPDIEIDAIKEFATRDRIVFDKAPLFALDDEVDIYPDTTLTGQARVDAIYGYYDDLMSNNQLYITKTALCREIGGNTLYRYDFKNPEQTHRSDGISQEKPKVILVSGIHPELSGIYSLFNTMKEITTNPKLQELKNNVQFIVVPIVNPYGLVNGTRTNANGVDLARNYSIGWIAGDDRGEHALSEAETVAIDNILKANADAILYTSCHSFQGSSTDKDFIWVDFATAYGANIGEKIITKLSQEWGGKYDELPTKNGYISGNNGNLYIGTSQYGTSGQGTEGRHATQYGIHGGVVEVCDYFHFPTYQSQHLTPFVISRGTETYINWILAHTYNYDIITGERGEKGEPGTSPIVELIIKEDSQNAVSGIAVINYVNEIIGDIETVSALVGGAE